MHSFLEFERPVADLLGKIQELRTVGSPAAADGTVDVAEEIARLEAKANQALADLYAKLTPWQKTLVARHPDRPHTLDYVGALVEDFVELAGDRAFGEDAAIVAGIGRFRGRSVAVLGQERGRDTQSRLARNFGMARPEGYRKAVRIMKLAERFRLPVLSFVDTAGAYPGIGAEERGQAEAIARSTEAGLSLTVPSVAVVIGEGGSGGAIALAAASRVYMLEHAVYGVISPEGAASILWRDSGRAQDAAAAMRITAQDLDRMKVIDGIVPEPLGGAHRDREKAIAAVGDTVADALAELSVLDPATVRARRIERFMEIGRSL